MRIDTQLLHTFRFKASYLILLALLTAGSYASYTAFAHSNGMTGRTQKSDNQGCYCHCSSSYSGTSVTIATQATNIVAGGTYDFTLSVTNSGEVAAGCDIAAYSGTLNAGTGLQKIGDELTHTSPRTLPATFTFTYTAPNSPGTDTIYATANAVNNDGSNGGGNCTDHWNFAQKFVVTVNSAGTKIASVGRTSISLGSIRVGQRRADSTIVRSTGTLALTVSSSSMKTGTSFSAYPSSTNRSIAAGSSEIDSVIFTPTTRGTFSDSLIINTDADAASRKAIYVSGQAVQAVFSGSGTTMSFGNVRTNRTVRINYSFQNTGDDTLFLSSPSLSGTGFSITTQPGHLTLLPNERDSVVIQFAPTAKQAYSGTLSFTAQNGISIPSVSISGTGVAPQLSASTSAGLGAIRVGQALQGSVTIRNTGNDTLRISNVVLNQSGTKFSLGTFDNIILGGQQGTFHISFAPTSEKVDSATLTFATDDPSNATFSILVTAAGVLPHMQVARDTVNMGEIKVGTSTNRDLSVSNAGTDNLSLYNPNISPNPPFSFVSKQSDIGAGQTGFVTVKFAPTTVGTFIGRAVILSDDPNHGSDTIYLKGSGINSALDVPATLDFGGQNVGQPATQRITFTNTGSAPVTILSYKLISTSSAFRITDSAAHSVAGNGTASIGVSFTPTDALPYSATLQLTTDDASTPIRTVALAGRGQKGSLSLSTTLIDFGTVDTGMLQTHPFVIKNTGTAPISISSYTATGSKDFSIVGMSPVLVPPFSLNAGDSVTFTIGFKPSVAGMISSSVSFTTSDNNVSTIQLQGIGHVTLPSSGVRSTGRTALPMMLAPNPALHQSTIRLNVEDAASYDVWVFDLSGHSVKQFSVGQLSEGTHEIRLDLNLLANGTYLVRLTSSTGEVREGRLVIER